MKGVVSLEYTLRGLLIFVIGMVVVVTGWFVQALIG